MATQEFAKRYCRRLVPIGTFNVAGFAEKQTAFGLDDEAEDGEGKDQE
ncbi:MAG: hypothetical protein WAM75_16990 [Xanthobacteraceae bacterium]